MEIHKTRYIVVDFKIIQNLILDKNQIENVSTLLQCMGSSIQGIDVSGNYLGSLNRTTFHRFKQLQFLMVASTQLVEFDFSAMANKYIIILDMSANGLTFASNVSAVKEFRILSIFKAAGNYMQNTSDLIHHLTSRTIHDLDLSDNFVGRLNQTTFIRFTGLQILKLRNTQTSISDNFNPFEQLQQIRHLDISHNNLDGVNFASMTDRGADQ